MFDLTKLDESDTELFEEIVRDQVDFLEIAIKQAIKQGGWNDSELNDIKKRLLALERLVNKISV